MKFLTTPSGWIFASYLVLLIFFCVAFAVPGGPTAFWGWFAPGMEAIKNVAPLGSFLAVSLASWAALRTLRLRSKIDDADQWWKRAQFGIDLIHRSAQEKAAGTRIIESLVDKELPADATDDQIAEHNRSKALREAYGWKVSEVDLNMLRDIADQGFIGPVPVELTQEELAGATTWTQSLVRRFRRKTEEE